ncbi:hypothetical protein B0W01_24945 [Serratia marcescens]|nr:hypothetical protein B0W01_24945 [Serratia marcescens]
MMANIYGVVAEHTAPHKGYRDVVHQTGPMISGQLRLVLSEPQILQVTFGYLQAWHNSFRVEQDLCRRNSHVQIKQEQHSGSPEDKHCLGSRKLGDLPSLEAQTVAATCTPGAQKEKDNAANVALWDDCFFSHQENQYFAVLQYSLSSLGGEVYCLHTDNIGTQSYPEIFGEADCICLSNAVQLSTYKKSVGQPSGDSLAFLRCRRLISPCMAVTINCPVVSPSSLTDSIASTTSCGARACTFCDFALIAFVAKAETSCCWWRTVYTKDNAEKVLTCLHLGFKVESTLSYLRYVYDEAQKDGNPLWASNHNVTEAYIMACSHDTQTRPKFVYLFLGTPNEFPDSTPTVLRAEADTEDDARAKFPRWTLTFAAQIRTAAPCRLQIFSTDDGFMWVYEQRQAAQEEAHA